MTAYNNVARNETEEEEATMMRRELMAEKTKSDSEDPSADKAIVPFLPKRVSIR